MLKSDQSPFLSTRLISLNKYFDEMVSLYESGSFPNVLLLGGKKGIGKFTLVFHFLNYVYSKNEETPYIIEDKLINSNSNFYKSILNQTNTDVIFLQAEERKNIKINDIRNLKSIFSKTSFSNKPRFTIIDEVEFLNANSVNALLKTLEEPSVNNYFILINNQQANLIDTLSSRCLKNNIYLNTENQKKVIEHFVEIKKIDKLFFNSNNLTPGTFLKYNDFFNKYNIDNNENISLTLKKLLNAYQKDKDKNLINMSIFIVERFFYQLIKTNISKINFLIDLKSTILYKINDFIIYNLNINSVLNSIELNLKRVR